MSFRFSRKLTSLLTPISKSIFTKASYNPFNPNITYTISHFSTKKSSKSKTKKTESKIETTPETISEADTLSETTTEPITTTESTEKKEEISIKPEINEKISNESLKSCSFQTETQELLNIVAKSLYTDKEVFIRELLSNASDALEKVRYNLNKNSGNVVKPENDLQINVYTDIEKGIIVIQDNGIGMNDSDLAEHLGTIAKSGSKAFVKQQMSSTDNTNNSIIGQFGVGFYSVFMVADKVDVYSCSSELAKGSETGWYWTSDGSGKYTIGKASNVVHGTKIVIHVKKDTINEFCQENNVKNIIKKYSSYLSFPIYLNGKKIESAGAIWAQKPNSLKDKDYKDFYQLIVDRNDDPYYVYHTHIESSKFNAQCLLFFPPTHSEKFGGKLDPGLNMYCKKVLVKKNAPEIAPDWMRFIKGAVDSENIPIHISRENMQDSILLNELKDTIMSKTITFLTKQMSKDKKKYDKWYHEFSTFIKEGICIGNENKNKTKIAKLLQFESSITKDKELITLDDYLNKMTKDQTEIYYIVTPNRDAAMHSPYIESFISKKQPVLLCFEKIDEFVFMNLENYSGKKTVNIETSKIKEETKDVDDAISKDDITKISQWIKNNFGNIVNKVDVTYRLNKHAVVLVDHQSYALRTFLKMQGEDAKLPPQSIQINPKHNIIKGLLQLINDGNTISEKKARIITKQLINNAFISAGVFDDPRDMVLDINNVMEMSMGYIDNIDSNVNKIAGVEGVGKSDGYKNDINDPLNYDPTLDMNMDDINDEPIVDDNKSIDAEVIKEK